MTAAPELIEYIFGNKGRFCAAFSRALAETPRFGQFVEEYRDKIRKKIATASHDTDAVEDVLAELWVAYLLLHVDQFSRVQYEAHVISGAGPDLTVTYSRSGLDFNVEVKRIRRTDVERRFVTWLRQLKDSIRKTRSGLAVSVRIGYDYFDTRSELLDDLEGRSKDVIEYITTTILASDGEMSPGSKKECSVPGFEEEFEFTLRKPSRTPTSDYTSYDYGMFPDFATHNEYKKFGDEICDPEHLGQMLPDMVNILAITTDSGTHADLDLDQALASLNRRAAEEDDQFFINKGFKSVGDFMTLSERLSGIILAGAFFPVRSGPKAFWCNNRAEYPVPTEICNLLQSIVCRDPMISFDTFIHDADRLTADSSLRNCGGA